MNVLEEGMAHARENRGALLSPLLGELVICQLFSLEIFCGRFASLEHECLMADEDDIIHIFQTIMRLFYSFNYSFSDLNGICGPCPSMNGIDRRLQPFLIYLVHVSISMEMNLRAISRSLGIGFAAIP